MWAGRTGGVKNVWWGGVLGTAEAFSGFPREPPAGPGGDPRLFCPALIEVVVRDRFRFSGIERGALVEVVGEGFLGDLFCLPTVGPHGELGLGWSPGGMEERG